MKNAAGDANTGTTSTPSSPKLRLDQSERLRSRRSPGGRHEAQREPLPAAGEDPVRSPAAAGLLEQAAGLRRSIAIRAPVWLVVAGSGSGARAVEYASGGVDLAEYLSDERSAVDPVCERAANELVAKRRVRVRLRAWTVSCSKSVLTGATKRTPGSRRTAGTTDGGPTMATSSSPLPSSSLGSVADTRESDDEPLDVGRVRPPVAGVARGGRAAGRARSRSTRNGPLPMGRPVLGSSIRSPQTCVRSEPRSACDGRMFPKKSRQRADLGRRTTRTVLRSTARALRMGAWRSRTSGVAVTAYGLEREDEILRRDRDSVAPARRRADVVGQCERSLPRVVDPRDEAFLVREVGTDLEWLLQNLLVQYACPP